MCVPAPDASLCVKYVVSLCKIKQKIQTNKPTHTPKEKEGKNDIKLSLLAFNVHAELAIPSEVARHELHDIFTMMSIIDYASSHLCTGRVMGMIASPEAARQITFRGGNHTHHICCANMR